MPMRTRSRVRKPTRRRAISRKKVRLNSKAYKRKTFKSHALSDLKTKPKNTVYYETALTGGPTLYTSPSLNAGRCISISNNASAYDTRAGKSIFLKGIRMRMFFQNRQLRPVVCHCALIRPKADQFIENPDIFKALFFKRMGTGGSGPGLTGINFDDLTNGMEYASFPINTEQFHVMWHLRFKLGVISTTGGYSSGELKNYRTVMRYVKVNKVINFPDTTSPYPDNNEQMYLAIWSCPMDFNRAAEAPNPESLQVSTNVVAVFTRSNGT